MQRTLKSLFTGDLLFTACTVMATLVNLIIVIFSFFSMSEGLVNFSYVTQCFIEGICVFFVWHSYKKHQKNVTKGLLGFLLAINLMNTIEFSQILDGSLQDMILEGITVCLTAVLTINHFIINSTHRASPKAIFINQLSALVLIAIGGILWSVLGLLQKPEAQVAFTNILSMVGYSGKIALIVCVESRLDAYRLDREAAGWTEENGYPEGYVHEYEKSNK